jgi:carboxypeptidase Q
MQRHLLPPALALACTLAVAAQQPSVSNPGILEQILREGQERSQVMTAFDQFVTVIGPRLAGSPEYQAAAEWSREAFAKWGLGQARLEPFEFGRGWVLDRQVIEMIEPRYMPLVGYAEAWSTSTRGEIVGTPIYVGDRSGDEVKAMAGKLSGAIVLSQPLVTAFVREDRRQPADHDEPVRIGMPPMPRQGSVSQADARQVAQILREANPGVILRASAAEHGTMFVLGRDQGENARPSIVLAAEHYNMIARMLEAAVPVKLRVDLQTRYLTGDTREHNVLADLPGSDPALRDQVVIVGAHLDSWHSSPGATDNADGSAVVLEAARILKAIGANPRRTIRFALWGAEEQGLIGARAHVAQHYAGEANTAAREKVAMYLNIDPGMGPIYGWYMEENAAAKAVFDEWLKPLAGLGVKRNVIQGMGSTDHVAFRQAGIPAFNPIQDYVDYDVRTHHTNVDTYERVRAEDLRQNAIVMAWFAYQAAMMDDATASAVRPR